MSNCQCSTLNYVPATIVINPVPTSSYISHKPNIDFTNLGYTIKRSESVYQTLQESFAICPKLHSLQFYLDTYQADLSSSVLPSGLSSQDKILSTKYCLDNNKSFYFHCPLNMNLSRSDYVGKRMFNIVQHNCNQVISMPASCVLHVGNSKKGGTIYDVANNVNDLNLTKGHYINNPYPLLLENCAGQGNDLGCTLEEFRHLYEALDKTVIGVCFDTQHMFASGMCEFNNHHEVDKVFENIESICGRPALFHLNDSKVGFGRRTDRHENLGAGYIWSRSKDSLFRLRELCQDNNIDLLLETPATYRANDINIMIQ